MHCMKFHNSRVIDASVWIKEEEEEEEEEVP
jgi:hypothetical protein